LGWIWEGTLSEVFGATAFATKFFEGIAKGGANVVHEIRGPRRYYVACFVAGEHGDYIFFRG
jgi:hypothetical protein